METITPQYPIDFTENGDATNIAIEKHIKELQNVYTRLTDLYAKTDTAKTEINSLLDRIKAMGNVIGKNVGTMEGNVPLYGTDKTIDANVTGSSATIRETLPIAKGGTGTTSLPSIREAIGLGNTTGLLGIDKGGTNAATAAQALINLSGQKEFLAGDFINITIDTSGKLYTPQTGSLWFVFLILVRYQMPEGAIYRQLSDVSASAKVMGGNALVASKDFYDVLNEYYGFMLKIK